jgi:Type I phosphodiesterase / nucleotide pyrophosphatase
VGNSSIAGKMSPKNLLVSTVTDQLRIANSFKSKTIGIALKDRGAILPAGHTANAAYWLDGSDGNWISSTFYMNELPKWVADYNAQKPVENYRNKSWTTLLPIENYTESTPDDQAYESKFGGETKSVFPHNFLKTTGNINELIKSTPFGNDLTKDFALETIENEGLGMGNYTDFLTVSFSSPDYVGHAFGPNSVEIEDVYLKLDANIAEILTKLDAKLGKNNYVVFLSADHGVADVPGFWKQNKLPAGVLAYGATLNVANQALKEKLGIEKLIESEENSQLYLNDQIMKDKNLKMSDVFPIIKQRLMPMDMVADVINLHNLETANLPLPLKDKVINGVNTKRSGDIMILLKPMYFTGRPTGTTHGSIYNYDTHVPALFFGWNIPKGESSLHYSISDIAPTISNLLNILEPSGNIGNPIIMK